MIKNTPHALVPLYHHCLSISTTRVAAQSVVVDDDDGDETAIWTDLYGINILWELKDGGVS